MTDSTKSQVTDDTLFEQHITCRQHKDGYRFSIDPVLVAHFSRPKESSRVLDLGAGCGVIGLILAYRYKDTIQKICSLEIQASLFDHLQHNIAANGYGQLIFPVRGDLKNILYYFRPESIDHVYCNPPFFSTGSGRTNNNEEAYGARHQIHANLQDVTEAAKKVLVNRGSITLCYPAKRITELFRSLAASRLEIKRIQLIYSYPESTQASLVIVEAIKNGGAECLVLPPFFVYECKNGQYSNEMQNLYRQEGK